MSKISEYIDGGKYGENIISIIYRKEEEFIKIQHNEFQKYIRTIVNYLEPKYKGKKIAIIGKNRVEYLITFLAVYGYIGDAILIDHEATKSVKNRILEQLNPELIVYEEELDIKYKCDKISFEQINRLFNNSVDIDNISINSHKGNLYLHTSGTTGEPKIIELSEENVFSVVEELGRKWLINEEDLALIIVPLYHIYALLAVFHAIHFGCAIVLENDYKKMMKTIQYTKVTIIVGVPLMFNKIKDKILLNKKLLFKILFAISNCCLRFNLDIRKSLFKKIYEVLGNRVRFCTSAGSILTSETTKFYDDIGLEIYNAYGMTETSGPIAVNYKNNNLIGSVGKILDITNVEIRNKNLEEIGEIWVKGENVFKGYLNENLLGEDFFDTGDIGYVKDDFLFVVGRKKNILIGDNGKNIAPEEIIREILKYKGIENCGIIMENNYLKAIINTNLEYKKIEKIIDEVNKKMPNYKKINSFEITKKEIK